MKIALVIVTLIAASISIEIAISSNDSPPCVRMANAIDIAGDCRR